MLSDLKLKEIVQSLTLEEKVGQMVQLVEDFIFGTEGTITGPLQEMQISPRMSGLIGSVLGSSGAEKVREVQSHYMNNCRHKIPLLFMADVIHGYRTILPIPLAQASSFDPCLVEEGARMAADEAAAGGVHVNFSPMCDLTRDPRWGRVMESTGEDHWLNGLYSAAMVRGYQKEDLANSDALAACVKHFAAYGAAEAGRDYNTVDMSERTLREFYLPAYKKALNAGCAMVMTSFNTIDGIPATASKWLLRDLLRNEWGFDGVIISDWNAIQELIAHGVAADRREAAKLAIEAGVDIDMMSPCYANHLVELVISGEVDESLLDQAVMRILRLKNRMGLFTDPFHGVNPDREKSIILSEEHRRTACEVARNSLVLLKNSGVLPLSPDSGKIALIGPYAQKKHILGGWSCLGEDEDALSLADVFRKNLGDNRVIVVEGCDLDGSCFQKDSIDKAISEAEVILLAVGEHPGMSGEAGSRAMIDLPGKQMELCNYVMAGEKPCVVIIYNGRPLDLREINRQADALLEAWFPGTEGSQAIYDIITGRTEPRGRLAMSFPYVVGQVPVYYNCFNTGRPKTGSGDDYFCSGYLDIPNDPLFPFGYGLAYTTFEYSEIVLSNSVLKPGCKITASINVKNTGTRKGSELVQLYIRDLTGSVVRPVRELKGFQWVDLEPGQSVHVEFIITADLLRFYNADKKYIFEEGIHHIMIGTHSQAVKQKEIRFKI